MRKKNEEIKRDIVSFIQKYMRDNKYCPSYEEIGAAVGLSSKASVAGYMKELENEGALTVSGFRSIRINRTIQVPIIKGNHDRFLHNAAAKKALAGIKDYDDISVTLDDGTVRRCILSHYFIPFYNGHRYNAVHLHGHSHFTAEATEEFIIAKTLNESK